MGISHPGGRAGGANCWVRSLWSLTLRLEQGTLGMLWW
jgi:hypothetical protein